MQYQSVIGKEHNQQYRFYSLLFTHAFQQINSFVQITLLEQNHLYTQIYTLIIIVHVHGNEKFVIPMKLPPPTALEDVKRQEHTSLEW